MLNWSQIRSFGDVGSMSGFARDMDEGFMRTCPSGNGARCCYRSCQGDKLRHCRYSKISCRDREAIDRLGRQRRPITAKTASEHSSPNSEKSSRNLGEVTKLTNVIEKASRCDALRCDSQSLGRRALNEGPAWPSARP